MNLNSNKSRLTGLTRNLSVRWKETRHYWRDAKSEEFEQRHLTELFAQMDRVGIILDKLEELLKKVRSDCE